MGPNIRSLSLCFYSAIELICSKFRMKVRSIRRSRIFNAVPKYSPGSLQAPLIPWFSCLGEGGRVSCLFHGSSILPSPFNLFAYQVLYFRVHSQKRIICTPASWHTTPFIFHAIVFFGFSAEVTSSRLRGWTKNEKSTGHQQMYL